MTESNTSSDLNTKRQIPSRGSIKSFKHGEKRFMQRPENPRERMTRVVMAVRKTRKKKR